MVGYPKAIIACLRHRGTHNKRIAPLVDGLREPDAFENILTVQTWKRAHLFHILLSDQTQFLFTGDNSLWVNHKQRPVVSHTLKVNQLYLMMSYQSKHFLLHKTIRITSSQTTQGRLYQSPRHCNSCCWSCSETFTWRCHLYLWNQ